MLAILSPRLSKSPSLARVIHAIECRPSLLFLIRLAPYPYNVMNTLLASSRTLSLKVYIGVTGISLFKLMFVFLNRNDLAVCVCRR